MTKTVAADKIRELFDYDHATGELTRRTGKAAGRLAGSIDRGRCVLSINGKKGVRRSYAVWAWHHGKWPDAILFYRDGDMLNDRIENLRPSGHRDELTAEVARALFYYEPSTGVFLWKKEPYGRSIKSEFAGGINDQGYRVVRVSKKPQRVHRLAWLITYGTWPERDIDHINGDRSDNRLCNLRLATKTQNSYNQRKTSRNKSGRKGVSWDQKRGRWQVHIAVNGKCTFLGRFDDINEAAKAYERRAVQVAGEFARTE